MPADVKRERLVVRIAGNRRCGQRVVAEEDGDVPFHAEIVRCAERAAREHDIRLAVRNRSSIGDRRPREFKRAAVDLQPLRHTGRSAVIVIVHAIANHNRFGSDLHESVVQDQPAVPR